MSNSVDTVLEAVQQRHLGTRVGSLLATSTCIKPLWPVLTIRERDLMLKSYFTKPAVKTLRQARRLREVLISDSVPRGDGSQAVIAHECR